MTNIAEIFSADVRAVMDELCCGTGETVPGGHPCVLGVSTVIEDGSEWYVDVPCVAVDHGHERTSPEASTYAGERLRLATAIVMAMDMPGDVRRGDSLQLFGCEWQARSVRRHGLGQGQVVRITLARDERSRGGA